MAVNNEDRVSTAKLLETLKGLQASRHLGSEPEVVTETTEYPAVVSPAVGTYQTAEELNATMTQEPDENRFPIKVYTTVAVPADGTFPFTVNEPSGNYVEITKKVNVNGGTIYGQADFPDDGDVSSYTGYAIGQNQGGSGVIWMAMHIVNGSGNLDAYQWEMPAKTETITTKTKHTIKQDYVPNADWNVNDPDADGYVEGRTHWVEESITDVKPDTYKGVPSLSSFAKPYGYSWEGGEWYPEFEAVNTTFEGIEMWWLAVDANNEQITEFTENALSTATNYVVCMNYTAQGIPGYIMAKNPVTTVRAKVEVIHKLDKKFYEMPSPTKLTPFVGGFKYGEQEVITTDESFSISFDRNNHLWFALLMRSNQMMIPFNLYLGVGTYDETTGTYTKTVTDATVSSIDAMRFYQYLKNSLYYSLTDDNSFTINLSHTGYFYFGPDPENTSADWGIFPGYLSVIMKIAKNTMTVSIEAKVKTNKQLNSGIVTPAFSLSGNASAVINISTHT